ncbi:MAG TPA: hypothetical protein VF547_09950 [Allosphingosinicella sp.]|jgi:hypothetical protein
MKKFTLAAVAAATAFTAVPAAAQAQYYGGYDRGGYDQGYYGRGDYDRNSDGRYYGRSYRGDRNYNRRCSGTTGTIVGGVAGALLGREVTRGGSRYGRRGSGPTGTILGGALGALAGRAVDKSSCRNRY